MMVNKTRVKAFDRIVDVNGETGMKYIATQAEFLTSVTYEIVSGRKLQEGYNNNVSPIGKVINRDNEVLGRNPYFDETNTVNYDPITNNPINVTNQQGQITSTWQDISYDAQGNQTQKIQEIDPRTKENRETYRYYNAYGDERTPEVANVQIGSSKILALIAALFPILVILINYLTGRGWRKWHNNVISQLSNKDSAGKDLRIYDEEIAEAALERFSSKVLGSIRREGRLYTTTGDTEGLFSFGLNNIYIQYVSYFIKKNNITDVQSIKDDPRLNGLDAYMQSAAQYLAEEIGRGADKGVAKYELDGKGDPQVWDKFVAYFNVYQERMRKALGNGVKTGNYTKFEEWANEMGISLDPHKTSKFDFEQFNNFIMQELQFESAPLRNLTPQQEKAETKKLNRRSWNTFFGWGLKAIHPLAFEFGLLPRFIFSGLLISLMYLGNVSLLGYLTTGLVFGIPVAVVSAVALTAIVIGSLFEWNSLSHFRTQNETVRILLGGIALASGIALSTIPGVNVGTFVLKCVLSTTLLTEAFSYLVWKHSAIGFAIYYHFRPSINAGRLRTNLLIWSQYGLQIGLSALLGWTAYPWFLTEYMSGNYGHMLLALGVFANSTYLINSGLWSALVFIASLIPVKGIPKPSAQAKMIADADKDSKLLINYVGAPLTSPGTLAIVSAKEKDFPKTVAGSVETVMEHLQWLIDDDAPSAIMLLEALHATAKTNGLISQDSHFNDREDREDFLRNIKAWLVFLYEKEQAAGVSLWTTDQLTDKQMDPDLRIPVANDDERNKLIIAFQINRMMSLIMGSSGTLDAGISLIDTAHVIREQGLGKRVVLMITINKYEKHDKESDKPGSLTLLDEKKDLVVMEKFARLFGYISQTDNANENAFVSYNHTVVSMKSGAMNGIFARPEEMRKVKRILILDRNANSLDLRAHTEDIKNLFDNPNVVVAVAHRNTTNTRRPVGEENRLVEGGQGNVLQGLTDKVGTGWENQMGVYFWDVTMKLSNPEYPAMPLTTDLQEGRDAKWRYFGLFGFMPNAPGISEDYWAVIQQAHNLIGLGRDPVYALSQAIHHKRRETFSNGELNGAVPRWAGGRNQSIQSSVNQTVNELGPESYAEREAVRNTARHYVAQPFGFLNLIFLPISIIFGFMPFSGVHLGLLVLGTFFNQVARLHGLKATMDDSGGLFGFARFLSSQFRDTTLFATRVMLETFGFIKSYFGLPFIFATSPTQSKVNEHKFLGNLRSDVKKFSLYWWTIGIGALLTTGMVAVVTAGLNSANIIMLFFPIYFMANMTIGMFVTENKPGKKIAKGWGDALAASMGVAIAVGQTLLIYQSINWLAGTIALAAIVFGAHKKFKNQALRFVSELNRFYWRTIVGTIWFALVPKAAFFKFALTPTHMKVFSFVEFVQSVLMPASLVIGAILAIGYTKGAWDMRVLNKRYKNIVGSFYNIHGTYDTVKRTVIEARIHQVGIYMDQQAYRRAKGALDDIENEMGTQQNVNGDQAMQSIIKKVPPNRISKYFETPSKPTGGIDLRKTLVDVDASHGVIQTTFDDPAMLRLLLNSDGLIPIINDINVMTPVMKAQFVGVD
jgi:hypothetical protein